MKVLVTGGSGLVGKHLKEKKPEWVYVSSKDYDLTREYYTRGMFYEIRPDAVVHLAAKTGGIKASAKNQEEFFYKNTMINTNVVKQAVEGKVPRLLAALSTCAFPDTLQRYPFAERDIFSGPPAKTNFSYGYSKRMLHIQCMASREQHGLNYSTFAPSNLYGPGDNFDFETSHFVAAMIRKLHEAKNGDTIEFWGTGRPLRQQLYVDDLVNLIPILLERHNSADPIIVAPRQNLSIKEMVDTCLKISGKDVKYIFNGKLEGQHRKDGSNQKLLNLIGGLEFTTIEDGLGKTYEWYKRHQLKEKAKGR